MRIETLKQTNKAEQAGGFLTIASVAKNFKQMRKYKLYITVTPTEYP